MTNDYSQALRDMIFSGCSNVLPVSGALVGAKKFGGDGSIMLIVLERMKNESYRAVTIQKGQVIAAEWLGENAGQIQPQHSVLYDYSPRGTTVHENRPDRFSMYENELPASTVNEEYWSALTAAELYPNRLPSAERKKIMGDHVAMGM
jgi:hypothetical protein